MARFDSRDSLAGLRHQGLTGRVRDPLFGYPLRIPRNTVYLDLDIEPDASDGEVRWAKYALSDRLRSEQREIERRLRAVYDQVAGLGDAYHEVQGLHAQGEGVDEEALREAQQRLRELEALAARVDRTFLDNRARVVDLEARIRELNSVALDSPEKRRDYDRGHPPLALLRVGRGEKVGFLRDPRTTLSLIRRAVAEFLAERVPEVFHPSDLTRSDFTGDFTATELLDDLPGGTAAADPSALRTRHEAP